MSRKPKLAFFGTLAAALIVGVAVGAAGSSQQDELDKRADQIADLGAQLRDEQARRQRVEENLTSAKERIKKLSAAGEVPDFTGGTVEDAGATAADYSSKLKTRRQPSNEQPWTVIEQNPGEGTKLKAGRSIVLTVASPKPKQWVTLQTLSGGGSASKSDEFRIPEGRVRLYNMPGGGNNAITLYKAPDEYVDLLVNEIGAVSGKTRVYTPGTYYLDVTGDSYTVDIQQYK